MEKGLLFAVMLGLANPTMATDRDSDHAVSPELVANLNQWLDAETEYETRMDRPRIELTSQEQAEELHGVADRSSGRTRGLYDDTTRTIYLTSPWSADDPYDVSILLHEMVHHRQAAQHWYCPQAQEWRAYQIQAQWLEERAVEVPFYWPAIALQSSCAKRDIHPE